MVRTYNDLYRRAKQILEPMDGDLAGVAARELLCLAAEKTKEELLRDMGLYVPEDVPEKLAALVRQYMDGKPLQYLVGRWDFFGITLQLSEQVLIPRDDTAVVTALAMEAVKELSQPRVLDLCTGTGCIGLAMAHHLPGVRVTLADLSEPALRLAKENTAALHLNGRVSVVKADVRSEAPAYLGQYDVIVSNPPYITTAEMETLPHSVRDYEPHMALHGGEDGLDFYRAICRNYAGLVKPGGAFCFEFGKGQEDAVGAILREYGFEKQLYCRDTSNIIRAVLARRNGEELEHGEKEND